MNKDNISHEKITHLPPMELHSALFIAILGYFLFSVGGVIFEHDAKNLCGDTLMHRLNICFPMLNIYGAGWLFLFGIWILMPHQSTPIRVAVATALLSLLECICGKLSKRMNNGIHTWNYHTSNRFAVFCDGFCSIQTSLVWAIASLIVFLFLDHIF